MVLFFALVSGRAAAPDRLQSRELLATSACTIQLVRADGDQTWVNADNIKFYSSVLRLQPRVLEQQRDFCGLSGCQDLEFLLPLFKHVPGAHNLLPTRLLQKEDEVEPRDVIEVGANDGRVVDWYLEHTTKGTIYAVEHVPEFLDVLKRKYKDNPRVKVIAMSFLDPRLPQIVPKVDVVISAWSCFYEFNREEQREFVFRAYDMLKDRGAFAMDLPANPMETEVGRGGYFEVRVTGVAAPLHVHMPDMRSFLVVTLDKEDGGVGFTSLGFFQHNLERQRRYFFVFEKDETNEPLDLGG